MTYPSQKCETKVPVFHAILASVLLAFTIFHHLADGMWTCILTISALMQCLGVALLCMQIFFGGSVEGISAGALTLDAITLGLRLSSTVFMSGYLPLDASGDYVYQLLDVCSLFMTLWLLYRVLV